MSALDKFVGKYELVENENWEEFMKAMGTNFALRKLAMLTQSNTLVYEKLDEKTYHFKSMSPVRNSEFQFELGVEFAETLPDGKKVKSVLTYDDSNDRLLAVSKATKSSEKDFETVRYLIDDGNTLIIELTCDNVKCLRKYKRLA